MKREAELEALFRANKMGGKGALCVGLAVTRHARSHSLPIDPSDLLTESRGQVSILGKSPIQKILADYGISRVLAEEGGRTSRGSVGLMQKYVAFLNDSGYGEADLEEAEQWWVAKVRVFFAGKPLALRLDPAKSLRAAVRDLIAQAEKRQAENSGATIVGTILQHLVGAKLAVLLGTDAPMHGASVADAVSGRAGDFEFGDVVIHVSTSPGEALMRKCRSNLEDGKRPLVITTYKRLPFAAGNAEDAGIADRVEIFDVEQFLAGNIYELGRFAREGRTQTAHAIVKRYNELVDALETDPSLKIEIGG
jgi:hypothetical protein